MVDKQGVKNRLREWVDARYERYKDFAIEVGVSQVQVSQWLTGRGIPSSAETLEKFRALGMDTVWLMTGHHETKEQGKVDKMINKYESRLRELAAENEQLRRKIREMLKIADDIK